MGCRREALRAGQKPLVIPTSDSTMNDTSITFSEACQEDVTLVVGGLVELAVKRHRRDYCGQQPRGSHTTVFRR